MSHLEAIIADRKLLGGANHCGEGLGASLTQKTRDDMA